MVMLNYGNDAITTMLQVYAEDSIDLRLLSGATLQAQAEHGINFELQEPYCSCTQHTACVTCLLVFEGTMLSQSAE